jgi:VWFA-related protein
MFTHSHARAICTAIVIAFAVASATLLAGCWTAQPIPSVTAASTKPAPPLKLCAEPDQPPLAVASKPGYTQFAVTVTDNAGEPIPKLTKSDFNVSSGSQAIPISYFSGETTSRPVSIVMLIDISGSMETKLPTVRKALEDFMTKLNPCDEVAIYVLGSTRGNDVGRVTLIQNFTTDYQLANGRLATIKPYGSTALYDAVDEGIRTVNGAHYPDRTIVLITDGIDNWSLLTRDKIIAEVRAANIPIFCIGIGDPNTPTAASSLIDSLVFSVNDGDRVDAATLNDLARASHGRAFIVPVMDKGGAKAFKAAVETIGDMIGHSYTIGAVVPADSAPPPTATVAGHPDAVVRMQIEKLPPAATPALHR